MFETVRFEASQRLRGTLSLVIIVSLYVVFLIFFFKQLDQEVLRLAIDSIPPSILDAFGVENLSTIEGWLAAEVYNFVWIWALGIYFAYIGAGLIADDIDHDRMDILLLLPFRRSQLLAEKFASLLVPIVFVNAVLLFVVYSTVVLFGESIDPMRLLMAHVLSIPYLLTCAAIGIGLSVLFDQASVAQRVTVGVMATLQLIGFGAPGTIIEWVAYFSPRYYYDPAAIFIYGRYDFISAGILLLATVIIVYASQRCFQQRDV